MQRSRSLCRRIGAGLALVMALHAGTAAAQLESPASDIWNDPVDNNASDFYTLDDGTTPIPEWRSPDEILQLAATELGDEFSLSETRELSLLKWIHHTRPPAEPSIPYSRKRHFGSWVRDPHDDSCLNTRGEVLLRDSKKPVSYAPNNKCAIVKGLWKDPYTGELFENASQIQIDHVVPLKHAYISGAWRWKPQQRCVYANFVANKYHLMSVSGRENMRKGDRGPDRYMPPNPKYTCDYLENWLKIKMIWGLIMLPEETNSMTEIMKANGCSSDVMKLPKSELAKMREAMRDLGGCERFDGDMATPNDFSAESQF